MISLVTGLDRFRKEMQPAEKLFTREIEDFAKRYDALGKMTMSEFPDIDTQEYIYSFENLNGTSQSELDEIFLEISEHMEEFSRVHGIEKFCQFSRIGCKDD